ncbi:hypothetical protein L227DRAFT_209595 [Lentinus tigrinus ALCF2SS1-6]|uniref:Uncharacterized protein n=1 Tax=Lentinus tigrinus ALCF2SS1-6 TaxID=1328759 RepID=A0A5C2SP24_9APHY|nr:hypothetical protein L227DRAFT_209595 [Lentinus tigrinus ALCF2SS1-6]
MPSISLERVSKKGSVSCSGEYFHSSRPPDRSATLQAFPWYSPDSEDHCQMTICNDHERSGEKRVRVPMTLDLDLSQHLPRSSHGALAARPCSSVIPLPSSSDGVLSGRRLQRYLTAISSNRSDSCASVNLSLLTFSRSEPEQLSVVATSNRRYVLSLSLVPIGQ